MNTAFRSILIVLLSCGGFQTHAGLFSLEIVEPATTAGDIGTLQILYHGEEENLSFAVGGLDLKLTSSTAGVIKFLDAQVNNDDERWDIAVARQTTDNEVGELYTGSIFSPGLAPGLQVFAEVKYSLLGPGSTDLLLDVGGEDPLYQGDRGDVSSYVRSRGLCVGDCDPLVPPTEINLGDSWAVLREQLYVPPVIPAPQPTPVVPPQDPSANFPPTVDPNPINPEPIDITPIDNPPADTPEEEVDLPGDGPTVIEIGFDPEWPRYGSLIDWLGRNYVLDVVNYTFLQLPEVVTYDMSVDSDSMQWVFIGTTSLFTRNGQLQRDDAGNISLAYTMMCDASSSGLGISVPEPQAIALSLFATMGLLFRRRHQAA
jgi:hypothetical protein